MIQINYGEKTGKGYLEILSRKGDIFFNQPSNSMVSASEWLMGEGINLELRTKDRLEFQQILPAVMKEAGINRMLHLVFEMKEDGVVTSNEALIPLNESFSGACLEEALQKLITC